MKNKLALLMLALTIGFAAAAQNEHRDHTRMHKPPHHARHRHHAPPSRHPRPHPQPRPEDHPHPDGHR